jgi:hypothetical protein
MPRYRVVVYGGVDGLLFEDLIITYSSGYRYPLRVKQGDYVPVEIFSPLDIRKSLVVGMLGNYVRAGAVKTEYSDIEQNKRKRKLRQKNIEIKQPTKPSVDTPVISEPAIQQKTEDTPQVQVVPTDLKTGDSTDNFFKLSYFQRLKFIQSCNNKGILSDLLDKIDSEQLKHHIENQLQKL